MRHVAGNGIAVVIVIKGGRMAERKTEVGPLTENFTVRFIELIQFN